MRGRDDRGPGREGRLAADSDKAAVLDQAKQLGLERRRHVADLVEEQRAFASPLGIAEMALLRARERALLVAEYLALEKFRRDRRAVHSDKGFGAAREIWCSSRAATSLPEPVSPVISTGRS